MESLISRRRCPR